MRLVTKALGVLITAAALTAVPAYSLEPAVVLAPNEVLLRVESRGTETSRPDIMTIQAGVVTTGDSAAAALAANSVLANRLIDAVRAKGIAADDIRTERLEVEPVFGEDERRRFGNDRQPRITGYIAENSLELRLRDLERASDIIDALFQAGANSVRGPVFELSDQEPAIRRARRAAVAAARAEAADYAEIFGMRVARVLEVSERNPSWDESSAIIVTGSSNRTPIEPGEIETRMTVWVDFALAPN